MDMDNSNSTEVSTDYQYVSRKGKSKKKRRSRPNIKVSDQNSDNSDATEHVEYELEESLTNPPHEFIGENSNHNTSNKGESCNVIYGISIDAQLAAKPQILEAEEIFEKVELQQALEQQECASQMSRKYLEQETVIEPIGESKGVYNIRALSKHAETYELEKFEKNVLLIFNQENVKGYKPRLGTEKDLEALKNTFNRFGFEVKDYKDLTKKEIFDELERFFTKEDFTDYGCVGIAVMTHGSNMGLLWAEDCQYSEIEIINYFKVHDKPTLVTKPKFLIIQACRGGEIIPGILVFQSGKIRTDMDSSKEPYILPVEADLLVLHSSYVGSPSHRDEVYGSWFIQSLCKKINQLAATHDVESIITEVKREVAIDKEHNIYNRNTLEMQVNKQMPVMTSTLIRKLYLKKFGDPPLLRLTSLSDGGTCHTCQNSSNEVLDFAPPSTPMLVQFGPCSCFLEHFDYIKNCLRYFFEDEPEDHIAESYLELAETLEDGVPFNAAKEKLAKAMCKHLTIKAKNCHYYKYLYFYKHGLN